RSAWSGASILTRLIDEHVTNGCQKGILVAACRPFPVSGIVRRNPGTARYTLVGHATAETVRIRLIRKFAEVIDGIDLSRRRTGDLLDLPQGDARVLIAEGWACADDPLAKAARVRTRKPAAKKKSTR